MTAVNLFKALSDPTRLRILNLLCQGPLCVCHVHEILDLPQAKVSRQLGYLRERDLVETKRYYNWTLYSLPTKPNAVYRDTLELLTKTEFTTGAEFLNDLNRLKKTDTSAACEAAAACC